MSSSNNYNSTSPTSNNNAGAGGAPPSSSNSNNNPHDELEFHLGAGIISPTDDGNSNSNSRKKYIVPAGGVNTTESSSGSNSQRRSQGRVSPAGTSSGVDSASAEKSNASGSSQQSAATKVLNVNHGNGINNSSNSNNSSATPPASVFHPPGLDSNPIQQQQQQQQNTSTATPPQPNPAAATTSQQHPWDLSSSHHSSRASSVSSAAGMRPYQASTALRRSSRQVPPPPPPQSGPSSGGNSAAVLPGYVGGPQVSSSSVSGGGRRHSTRSNNSSSQQQHHHQQPGGVSPLVLGSATSRGGAGNVSATGSAESPNHGVGGGGSSGGSYAYGGGASQSPPLLNDSLASRGGATSAQLLLDAASHVSRNSVGGGAGGDEQQRVSIAQLFSDRRSTKPFVDHKSSGGKAENDSDSTHHGGQGGGRLRRENSLGFKGASQLEAESVASAFDDDSPLLGDGSLSSILTSGSSLGSLLSIFHRAIVRPCIPGDQDDFLLSYFQRNLVAGTYTPAYLSGVVYCRMTIVLLLSLLLGLPLLIFGTIFMYWASNAPEIKSNGGLLLTLPAFLWGFLSVAVYFLARFTVKRRELGGAGGRPSAVLEFLCKSTPIFTVWCLCWVIVLSLMSLATGQSSIPLSTILISFCYTVGVTNLSGHSTVKSGRMPFYIVSFVSFVIVLTLGLDWQHLGKIHTAFSNNPTTTTTTNDTLLTWHVSGNKWAGVQVTALVFTLIGVFVNLFIHHTLTCVQATRFVFQRERDLDRVELQEIVKREVASFTSELVTSLSVWDIEGAEELISLCEVYLNLPQGGGSGVVGNSNATAVVASGEASAPVPATPRAVVAALSAPRKLTPQQAAEIVPEAFDLVISARRDSLPLTTIEAWKYLVASLKAQQQYLPPTLLNGGGEGGDGSNQDQHQRKKDTKSRVAKLAHLVIGSDDPESPLSSKKNSSVAVGDYTSTPTGDEDEEGSISESVRESETERPLTEEELQSVGSRSSYISTNYMGSPTKLGLDGGKSAFAAPQVNVGIVSNASFGGAGDPLYSPGGGAGDNNKILDSSHNSIHGLMSPANGSQVGSNRSFRPGLPGADFGVIVPKRITMVCFNVLDFHSLLKRCGIEACTKAHSFVINTIERHVKQHKGVIDYFQGDHIFATFNAIQPAASHAKKAAVAALGAIEEIESGGLGNTVTTGTSVSLALGGAGLKITAGLSSGVAAVGSLGTEKRRRVCTVGPVVSQASVLERLTKVYEGVKVLAPGGALSDIGFECLYQAVDIVALPGSKPNVIASLESKKIAQMADKNSEWMYQLAEQQRADPFAHVNAAFIAAIDGDADAAQRCLDAKSSHQSDRSLIGERGAKLVINQLREGYPFLGTDMGLYYDRVAPSTTRTEFNLNHNTATSSSNGTNSANISRIASSVTGGVAGVSAGASAGAGSSGHSSLNATPNHKQGGFTTNANSYWSSATPSRRVSGTNNNNNNNNGSAAVSQTGSFRSNAGGGGVGGGSTIIGAGSPQQPGVTLHRADSSSSMSEMDSSTRGMLEASAGQLRKLLPTGTTPRNAHLTRPRTLPEPPSPMVSGMSGGSTNAVIGEAAPSSSSTRGGGGVAGLIPTQDPNFVVGDLANSHDESKLAEMEKNQEQEQNDGSSNSRMVNDVTATFNISSGTQPQEEGTTDSPLDETMRSDKMVLAALTLETQDDENEDDPSVTVG